MLQNVVKGASSLFTRTSKWLDIPLDGGQGLRTTEEPTSISGILKTKFHGKIYV